MTFDRYTRAEEIVRGMDLSSQTHLVTGAGGGIGLATAEALAATGAHVIVADIAEEASLQAIARIQERKPDAKLSFERLDLGSLAAVRACAAAVQARHASLDVLICNAGVMACPQGETVDGFERQFGINFLGHFLLANLLKPQLAAAGRARVVTLSSIGHRRNDVQWDDIHFRQHPYDRWVSYSQSKTACALLAIGIDEKWRSLGIRANTMNPGGSNTGLHQYLTDDERRQVGTLDESNRVPDRWRDPDQCAATSVWLATAPELADVGGKYFEELRESGPWTAEDPMKGVRPYALSRGGALRLWGLAESMVGH